MNEQLTHEHDAETYIWIENKDRESITQIGKCTRCGEDIARRVHIIGTSVFTDWVALP